MASLGDIETDIIAFVNKALRKSYSASGAELNIAIQTCLNDLANHNLLVGTDTDQTLVSGGKTLNYPTDFKQLISLTLIDSNSNEKAPLTKLKGGHKQYRELRLNDTSSGLTEFFSDFNSQFFLWRPADQAFTTNIEYYRYHPQDINSILFTKEFRNAIFYGTAFFESLFLKNAEGQSRWGPMFGNEKQLRRISTNTQPVIFNG